MLNYQDVKKRRLQLGISQDKLSEYTGIDRGTITAGERRNSRLMVGAKEVFERVFREIEEGNNPIYRNAENKRIKTQNDEAAEQNPQTEGIPLIPIDAMAGFGKGEIQVIDYETERYVVPEFTELKADFMIRVKGSSMYPKYSSGDIVACRKINLKDIFFQWNKVYVMDTEQGALIKRVQKGKDKNHILIVSDNEKYPPFELELNKLFAIAIVLGCVRME